MARQPIMDHRHLNVKASWSQTYRTRYDSSRRMISPTQRPLPDNTQQTNIHAPCGTRTRKPSKQMAADQPIWLRGTGICICQDECPAVSEDYRQYSV
jgi:hypothetical protein